jgi:hypothetical protein
MYSITARYDERYPCAAPEMTDQSAVMLRAAFGKEPGARANDGVVPVLSQVWGHVAWAGLADHLDVLGHFPGAALARPFWPSLFGRFRRVSEASLDAAAATAASADARHVDWLRSGAGFDERSFGALMDALAGGMLARC